jgi:transposase
MASSGCQRGLLLGEFPPPSTVQRYLHDWRDSGLLAIINHHLGDGRP